MATWPPIKLTMTTYHHGDLRAAVLEAAARMLEKEGVEGVSVREAARRAAVSHNAPYRHFRDRAALLDALASRGFEQLLKEVENRTGREMANAYVRFALQRPQLFRLMFATRRAPELEARFATAFSQTGKVGPAAAWSLVHGLALLLLDGHFSEEEAESFAASVISAVRLAQRAA